MNADQPIYTIDEFERESRYLETVVWEAIAIEPGTRVLFCGYGPDGERVRRAVDAGFDVTVIEHREREMAQFKNIGAKLLRGSTSVIPAKENTFDLAVAFHYLHEVDPFFHAQILSELARVARRIAVVEPAPPADPLGKRIALLYSQAKRELGQFEYYQPLEYWKKLLQAVKADITQHVFAFAKVPPREYLTDTVELLLRTMEVEEAPQAYIKELREIARRSSAQLLPPPRYVLVGAAIGELVAPQFSSREAAAPPAPVPAARSAAPPRTPPPAPPPAVYEEPQRTVSQDTGYEFPPVDQPVDQPAASAPPTPAAPEPRAQPQPGFGKPAAEPPPKFVPGLPFGAPAPPSPSPEKPPDAAPFGAPFAMPAQDPFGAPPAGIPPSSTWKWEPPDDQAEDDEPFKPG